ncbi:glycosyltransferase family 4 protein [Haloferacaceae archaeon DSL9]
MRIGIVVYGPLDERSGGYLYDRRLVEACKRRGDTVVVFSLPERGYLASLGDNLRPGLPSTIHDANLDVLLQDELCHPSLAGLNRRLGGDLPVVSIVHHLASAERRSRVSNAAIERLERAYLRTVDGFVFNSRTTARRVTDLVDPAPSVVAYPGGDRFGESISPSSVRERARDGPLRLLCVGSLTRRKGILTLLDGLSKVTRPWELTLVGDTSVEPSYVERVERQIAALDDPERATITGRAAESTLADYYERSHVLAMPSQYEGFGIVYLEGMAFGLPAIASTAGGASEIVTHGETGALVDPGDADAVAVAVERFARDRTALEAAGVAALERYRAHPTWDESGERIRSFLRTV